MPPPTQLSVVTWMPSRGATRTSQHRFIRHLPARAAQRMRCTIIHNHDSIDVFFGVDVGKSNHHAVALDNSGKKLLDKALPQDEAMLKSLSKHGTLLFVVDQPATIGALPVTIAQASGIEVGYLPGLAMRRIADLHPGEAKTDARDAMIIASAARTMPHTLRNVETADEQVAELTMLCGF
jgi:hypothetical protein